MDLDMGWDQWKETLAKAVHAGKKAGVDDRNITQQAETIGDFLARNVEPAAPEQAILQELWRAADENEQQAIASALVKLVQR